MTRLYVHIGPHKTGTTNFQSLLLNNLHHLDRTNIQYMNCGSRERCAPHHQIAWLYGKNPANHTLSVTKEQIDREIRLTVDHGRDLLLTSEELSTYQGALYELKKCASQYQAEVIPIIVFRPQGEVLNSAYTQRVKSFRSIRKFDDYFNEAINEPRFDYDQYYRSLFDDFNVQAVLHSEHWVREVMGVLSPDCDVLDATGVDGNRAPGAKQVEILRLIAPMFKGLLHFKRVVKTVKVIVPDDRPFWGISAAQREALITRFDAANQTLRTKVQFELPVCPNRPRNLIDIDRLADQPKKAMVDDIEAVIGALKCQWR